MLLRTHLLGTACAAALVVSPLARGVTISPGFDYFTTLPGTAMNFPPGTVLPPGYFGTYNGQPSDPLFLPPEFPLIGRPLGPYPPGANPNFFVGPLNELALLAAHNVIDPRLIGQSNYDTVVQRLGPADLPNIGDSATVPIQITQLSLQSAAPVHVTFGGAMFESFFDVWTELDASLPSPQGTMTISLNHPTGGTLTSVLPVNHRTTFHAWDPLVIPPETYLLGQLVFEGAGPWSTIPPAPGAAGLLVIAGVAARRRR